MPNRVRSILFLLLLVVCNYQPSSGSTSQTSLETVHSELQPATFNLLQASLEAEANHSSDQIQQLIRSLETKIEQLDRQLPENWGRLSTEHQIRTMFHLMHDNILTGTYIESCSFVSVAINLGDFNCVSATVIFQTIADRYNLPVMPVQTLGHVWSRSLSDTSLEIETTCPNWFQLSQAQREMAPSSLAGSEARLLTQQALVGKIYYNRATDRLRDKQYAAAVALLHTALNWDSADAAASGNLLASLNNWALDYAKKGQYKLANQKLDEVQKLSPQYQPLGRNRLYVRQCEISQLCKQGHFPEAIAVLENQSNASQLHPTQLTENAQTRSAIYDAWIQWLLSSNARTDAAKVLNLAQQTLGQEEPRFIRLKMKYAGLKI
ncbi:MAG: hypothetical protein COA78_01435 [Blastopirellula sp.]|nr:MAG: hypothetical protein COA78_01435 [Blastopirellula sp.]